MKKISVSAVVSAYNEEEYIHRCVKSILNQTEPFDEIILYNDASIDNTYKVMHHLKEQSELIRVIDSDINRGPGGGKNFARIFVTSEYFMYIDADDYLERDFLECLKEELCKKRTDIVFGGMTKVDENCIIRYKRTFKSKEDALIGGVSNWGVLFRKQFFDENEITIPEGKVLDDVLTRAVIACLNPSVGLAQDCTGYFYVDNSKSVSHTYMNRFISGIMIKEMNYLNDNHKKISKQNDDLYTYYAYKVVCWHLLKSGAGVGRKNMDEEREIAFNSLRLFFPEYSNNKYLKKHPPKGERKEVAFAVKLMFFLEKIRVLKLFLRMYASIDLSFLWPEL